jgi:hypothetical protein
VRGGILSRQVGLLGTYCSLLWLLCVCTRAGAPCTVSDATQCPLRSLCTTQLPAEPGSTHVPCMAHLYLYLSCTSPMYDRTCTCCVHLPPILLYVVASCWCCVLYLLVPGNQSTCSFRSAHNSCAPLCLKCVFNFKFLRSASSLTCRSPVRTLRTVPFTVQRPR